ncbi:tubulin-like doman-containing protein [Azospirillum picis]|nr:tubulin-like doman-containing protein [Azospirillum picis]
MPHVLIGLGATGGQVLKAFRGLVEPQMHETQSLGMAVRFLLVDTVNEAPDDATQSVPEWRTGFADHERVDLHPADLKTRSTSTASHQSSRLLHERVERAMRGDDERSLAALCADSRRLGRLLLAGAAASFTAALDRAVASLQSDAAMPLTFHIVFGLGEGPGGGLIEVVAGIRLRWRDPRRARILVYGRLPDPDGSGDDGSSNRPSNTYAALVELNALAAGELAPQDFTSGELSVESRPALSAAYLFGGTLENGQPLSDEDVLETAAQFLRQRMEIDQAEGAGRDRLRQLEGGAYGGSGPDQQIWSQIASVPLLAFGSKRLVSPDGEIREALGLSFTRAGLLHLLHNHWQDGAGFVDEPSGAPAGAALRGDVESRWLISEDHLLLSQAILPAEASDKRWQSITDEWSSIMEGFKDLARLRERGKWLDTLIALCHRRYTEDFRNVGVAEFYRSRYAEAAGMAAEVRARIERDLIEGCRTGRWSLGDLAGIVDSLIGWQEERLAGIPERIARIRRSEDETRVRIIGVCQKWASLGPFARISGKCEAVLDECAVQLHDLNVKMTRAEAWAFAGQLLPAILTELQDLKQTIEAVVLRVADVVATIDRRLDRLADVLEAEPNAYVPVVRLFNRDRLRGIAAAVLTDEREQRDHATRMRDSLFANMDSQAGFQALLDHFDGSDPLHALHAIGDSRVDDAHANHVATAGEGVLRLTVLDQIREMYGSDPLALRSFFDTVVSATHCLIELNGTASATERRSFALLPHAGKPEAFAKQVRAGIRACAGAEMTLLDTGRSPFEIGIVTIQAVPALSEVASLAAFDAAYQARLFSDTATAFYDMHTVSTATDLKPLVTQVPEHQKEMAAGFNLPHLLIGLVRGLVYDRRGGSSGTDGFLLVPKDADGFDEQPVYLGTDLFASSEALPASTVALLSANNARALSDASPAQLDDWRQGVVSLVNRTKAERGNDPTDLIYRKFVEAGKTASQMLRGERR